MKNINTSLFDFPAFRDPKSDYVYVDKTAQLYEIAKQMAYCRGTFRYLVGRKPGMVLGVQ